MRSLIQQPTINNLRFSQSRRIFNQRCLPTNHISLIKLDGTNISITESGYYPVVMMTAIYFSDSLP